MKTENLQILIGSDISDKGLEHISKLGFFLKTYVQENLLSSSPLLINPSCLHVHLFIQKSLVIKPSKMIKFKNQLKSIKLKIFISWVILN